jgi:hypothetical protein
MTHGKLLDPYQELQIWNSSPELQNVHRERVELTATVPPGEWSPVRHSPGAKESIRVICRLALFLLIACSAFVDLTLTNAHAGQMANLHAQLMRAAKEL